MVHDLDDFYSVTEVSQMLDALTEPDWRRLLRSSRYLADGHRILAADLRQEALARSLDGRRRCRRSFDVVNFLIGIMRSLTSQERETDRHGTREVGIDMLSMASAAPSPEQVGHDALHHRRSLRNDRVCPKAGRIAERPPRRRKGHRSAHAVEGRCEGSCLAAQAIEAQAGERRCEQERTVTTQTNDLTQLQRLDDFSRGRHRSG
jgi:hypothetical protein